MSEMNMSAIAGSYPEPREAVEGPIHYQVGRLTDVTTQLDAAVAVLSARLVHVTTPSDDDTLVGRLNDTKPVSPMTERLTWLADEVERIAGRIHSLTSSLEV